MKHGILPQLAMALYFAAGGPALASGAENSATIGIATANIAWDKPQDIEATFAEIVDAGFTAVRIGFKNPVSSSYAAMVAAKEAGLDILITFPLIDGTVSAIGAEPRKKTRRFFQAYGLSQIDPARFQTRLDELLDFVARQQIPVIGIEIGNELNWSGYNGDLPLVATGIVAADWHELPSEVTARFSAGLGRYRQILEIAKTSLASHSTLGSVQLVSAGLADINADFIRRSGATYVAPQLVYDAYGRQKVFDAVDVVGIHLYEPLRAANKTKERPAMIETQLGNCGEAGFVDRPCWITEFGSALPEQICAPDDAQRIALLRPLLDRLAHPAASRTVPFAFYYDWNADKGFSLKRCGHPTALVDELSGANHKSAQP
jgi:hypothetical protein